MKRAGIVGLGAMGGAVARRLSSQGWEVSVWNRSAAALRDLPDGVRAVASPAEAAASGLVISFVANDAALGDVTEGASGILSGLPRDGVHVAMSSVSPDCIDRLSRLHAGRMVAAPVFGRPEAAAQGLLWVALAGPEPARARALPLIEALARAVYPFGDVAKTALEVKIAGNFMIASAIEAMAEAFALLEAAGADARTFHAMMSDSIFGSIIHRNYGAIILDEAFQPPGFRLALGAKDVGLARDLATRHGLALPLGDLLAERFASAISAGRGDDDWNAISTQVRA